MQEERLATQAHTDHLTGLANRHAFDKALAREWKRTLRGRSEISLLLLEIDHFEGFSNLYGQQAADDCLRNVADAVAGALRATDIAARYSEEKIAIILPSTAISGALEVAEKIRSAVDALRIAHEGNPERSVWLTISIGAAAALAQHDGTFNMPASLLDAADSAVHKATSEGRNCVATAPLRNGS
ncbi:MAG: diguanylate cyclase [Terracidiphilus sp.]